MASSRNYTGNDAIDNVGDYVKEWWRVIGNMYEIIQQRDQFKTERDTLIDDLSWYKAKVSRLEQRISKLVSENTKLQNDLFSEQLIQDEADDKIKKLERENEELQGRLDELLEHDYDNQKLYKENRNLLTEISQHIGNKPSSSTYKYFRGRLNALEIREEPTSMSVADMQPMTEVQLTKDSSVQGVPLTNEAYEKAIKEGE